MDVSTKSIIPNSEIMKINAKRSRYRPKNLVGMNMQKIEYVTNATMRSIDFTGVNQVFNNENVADYRKTLLD